MPQITNIWADLYNLPDAFDPNRDLDHLFEEGETFKIVSLDAKVMLSPGHTLGSVTYVCGDAAFVHDTLMQPDAGTSRSDFPVGDTNALWDSIQDIRLHLSEVKGPVMDRLQRSHFLDELTGEVFLSRHAAICRLAPSE
ncbi:Beta-lactamase hydrolase-like protein [Pseudosulfitobacter sp. DSM 107133]|nr:Beta-lactamase hydrolase-like protein [Pseudosulfitobacter sp. DSM 107133]